jgi:hypothetical protein
MPHPQLAGELRHAPSYRLIGRPKSDLWHEFGDSHLILRS